MSEPHLILEASTAIDLIPDRAVPETPLRSLIDQIGTIRTAIEDGRAFDPATVDALAGAGFGSPLLGEFTQHAADIVEGMHAFAPERVASWQQMGTSERQTVIRGLYRLIDNGHCVVSREAKQRALRDAELVPMLQTRITELERELRSLQS